MKVLFVNTVCGSGSTGRICADLAASLEAQGNEATIAYGRESVMPDAVREKTIRIGSNWSVLNHGIFSRLFDAQGFCSRTATKRFIEWIRQYDPDIIHLHNIHGYYLNIEVLFDFLRDWNKPVVWTLHDAWAFTGHCVYFDYIGCDKWREHCMQCPQKTKYPKSFFIDRSKSNYKKKKTAFCGIKNLCIVTPSEWLQKCVSQSFLSGYRVEVIQNGIDTSVFKYSESSLREKYSIGDKKVVLGVSLGWTEAKHLDYLIQMADDLGDGYQIVIIGLGKNQKKQIPSNIIGICRTNDVRELAEWYSLADDFVNPTMEDNYPTVNLEAQACGTPVVTFNSGGSAECIKDGFGIGVERGNYRMLLEATREAIALKASMPLPVIKGKKEFSEEYMRLYMCLLNKQNELKVLGN